MEIQERSSGKIYSLSSTATLPEWLSDRSKRNLNKTDASYRHRITLLQDLEMPASSSKVRQSPDGQYLIVGGTYAPRIRCYELQEMSMKFERYLDSEVVDLLVLGDDYGKLAILGNDRSVSFHAPYGFHSSIRLPTFGRAMAYEKSTCDLLVVSSGKRGGLDGVDGRSTGQVYRFNLDEGRFSQTLTYDSALRGKSFDDGRTLQLGGSCIAVSPTHSLTAIGAEDGTVRFWDNRVPVGSSDVHLNPFLNLDVASATSGFGFFDDTNNIGFSGEVTSICFDSSGVHMCAGTKGGNVALYDMRSSKPLFIKEHQYGLPIHTVQFHSGSGTVLSSDAKLVKIWNAKGSASVQIRDDWNDDSAMAKSNDSDGAIGSIIANVEGTADFTHFIVAGDSIDTSGQKSGLLLCTGEQAKVQSFYCPMLGPAPKWCSFLDNITEELEEKDGVLDNGAAGDSGIVQTETIYEDYKFLTRTEIDQLGINNLVGTPLLRGYMHGFFIHVGLYNKVRAVAKPFEYNEYRTQKIKERMEEKRTSRIAPKTNPNEKKISAKVNPELAERLQSKASGRTKAGKAAKALVEDDRFGSLFNNPDFKIDEDAEDFKLRNPSGVAASKVRNDRDMDSDQEEDEFSDDGNIDFNGEQDEDGWGRDGDKDEEYYSSQSDDDDDGFRGGTVSNPLNLYTFIVISISLTQ
jgi:ribosome biogenesis protein ENP2